MKDLSVYVRSLTCMLAPELKLQLSCTNLQMTESHDTRACSSDVTISLSVFLKGSAVQ
jgi:hypothetical protein